MPSSILSTSINDSTDAGRSILTASSVTAQKTILGVDLGNGINYVRVDASSDNSVTNGTALRNAYTTAKALTPNGSALSSTNRAVVLIPPGVYNLGSTSLDLDTAYVDLIGESSNREHVKITSAVTTASTGTLNVSNVDVKVHNVTIRNEQNSVTSWSDLPCAVKITGGSSSYTNCDISYYSSYSSLFGFNVTVSAQFNDCYIADGNNGNLTLSGSAKDCNIIFEGEGCGASGTFDNCVITSAYSGTFSGIFRKCKLYTPYQPPNLTGSFYYVDASSWMGNTNNGSFYYSTVNIGSDSSGNFYSCRLTGCSNLIDGNFYNSNLDAFSNSFYGSFYFVNSSVNNIPIDSTPYSINIISTNVTIDGTYAFKYTVVNANSPTVTLSETTAAKLTNRPFVIKNIGTGVVTITPSGGGTIDGASSYTLPQYSSVTVINYSPGDNSWVIL